MTERQRARPQTPQDSEFRILCHSSQHPQDVLPAQFSLYLHKVALKPHPFHFIYEMYYSILPCKVKDSNCLLIKYSVTAFGL